MLAVASPKIDITSEGMQIEAHATLRCYYEQYV